MDLSDYLRTIKVAPPFCLPRSGPVPDALAMFEHASPAEQIRRTRIALEGARRLYRKRRFASLGGVLFFLARTPKVAPEPIETARRLVCAVAGTADLRAWERGRSRAAVFRALETALVHCAPGKGEWLEVVR